MWKSFFNRIGGTAWHESKNPEIVRTWMPQDVSVPKAWRQLANDIKRSVKERIVDKPIAELANKGLTEYRFQAADGTMSVYATVDRFANGETMKHVMVALPGVNDRAGVESLMDVFQQIALAFEPNQPAFHLCSYQGETGVVFHLLWPEDWNLIESHPGFEDAMPLWQNPVSLLRTAQGVQTLSADEFHQRSEALGFGSWKRCLIGNLSFLALALAHLDVQTSRDLFAMSISLDPLDLLAPDFGALVKLLKRSRLGPCPRCKHTACEAYGPDNNKKVTEIDRTDPCRQFAGAFIWPVCTTWYLGKFQYQCPKCNALTSDKVYLRIIDPVPKAPELACITRPLMDFLESMEGG